MKIIALIGKAKSGKDTFARIGHSVTKVIPMGLADSFKRSILEEYGFATSDVFGNGKSKESGYTSYPKPTYENKGLKSLEGIEGNKYKDEGYSYFFNDNSDPEFNYLPTATLQGTRICLVKSGDPHFWWSPREVMQIRGSDVEASDESALVKPLIKNIRVLQDAYRFDFASHYLSRDYDRRVGIYNWNSQSVRVPLIIITDVRKPHQLRSIRDAFSDLFSIKIDRTTSGISSKHISETSIDQFYNSDFDFMIKNDGDYASYSHSVKSLLANIMR